MVLKNKKLGVAFFVYLVLPLLVCVFNILPEPTTALAATPSPADAFGTSQFYQTWQRTDQPIASQRASRSWYWGPEPPAPRTASVSRRLSGTTSTARV